MRVLGLFIATWLMVIKSGESIDIRSGGPPVALIPKPGAGRVQTEFDLNAAPGSKMVLLCSFKVYSCSLVTLKIFDGNQYTQHCPEKFPYVFLNSWKNKMTVTIETNGPVIGAVCQVQATKPYIDVPEPHIDSSEHGSPGKSTRPNTCRCGWTNKNPGRIVGGKETAINEYPFPALVMFTANRFPFCGGSIISPYHVLTAAHCTDPFKNRALSVVVGEHDIRTYRETSATQLINVKTVHQHPGYTNTTNRDDIAILELATKIQYSDKVGPVCIPTVQQAMHDQYIKVMGWGLTKDKSENGQQSPVLRKVDLRIIDTDVCKTIYGIDTAVRTQICTYNNNKDSCQGDSGGPLVRLNPATNMYEQIALVSYGRKCGSTDPAVNTDVAYYLPWIKQQMSKSAVKADMCY